MILKIMYFQTIIAFNYQKIPMEVFLVIIVLLENQIIIIGYIIYLIKYPESIKLDF